MCYSPNCCSLVDICLEFYRSCLRDKIDNLLFLHFFRYKALFCHEYSLFQKRKTGNKDLSGISNRNRNEEFFVGCNLKDICLVSSLLCR